MCWIIMATSDSKPWKYILSNKRSFLVARLFESDDTENELIPACCPSVIRQDELKTIEGKIEDQGRKHGILYFLDLIKEKDLCNFMSFKAVCKEKGFKDVHDLLSTEYHKEIYLGTNDKDVEELINNVGNAAERKVLQQKVTKLLDKRQRSAEVDRNTLIKQIGDLEAEKKELAKKLKEAEKTVDDLKSNIKYWQDLVSNTNETHIRTINSLKEKLAEKDKILAKLKLSHEQELKKMKEEFEVEKKRYAHEAEDLLREHSKLERKLNDFKTLYIQRQTGLTSNVQQKSDISPGCKEKVSDKHIPPGYKEKTLDRHSSLESKEKTLDRHLPPGHKGKTLDSKSNPGSKEKTPKSVELLSWGKQSKPQSLDLTGKK